MSSKSGAANPFASAAEFNQETFGKATLENSQVLSKSFYESVFSHCSFRGTSFKNCRFVDCTFRDCDLSLARVEGSSFRDTIFQQCRMLGIDWTVAAWPHISTECPIAFHECALDYSTFIGLSLRKAKLIKCVAQEVDFSETDLAGADFSGTDLTNSRFRQSDLSRANFEGATNYSINLTLNKITKARFSMPEALSLLYGLDIVLIE